MKLGIVGCGWLGERLARFFSKDGDVVATVRGEDRVAFLRSFCSSVFRIDFEKEQVDEPLKAAFSDCDAVVYSLPVSKREFSLERHRRASALVASDRVRVILFSSVGAYPDRAGVFTEESQDDLTPTILMAETYYRSVFPDVAVLRLGGLMGDGRRFSEIYRDRPVPNPLQRVNHVHYSDVIGVVEHLINGDLGGGIWNVVAPLHPSKKEVFEVQTKRFSRPAEPLESKVVSSEKLREFGYEFQKPDPSLF